MKASVDGKLLPFPINIDTVNQLYGTSFDARSLAEYFARVAEPVAHARTSRRSGGEQGRSRPVREVLPAVHAQAVGARSVRARRRGGRARAGADQSRRPVLHRRVPGDAAAWLHPHVRADARPSQHRDRARHALRRTSRGSSPACPWCSPDRSTSTSATASEAALSLARVPLRDARSSGVPAGRGRQLPERPRVHPHHRVQVPDRAGAREDERRVRDSQGRRGPLLPGTAAAERGAVSGSTRRSPTRPRTFTSSAGWRRTATTTWTRWSRQALATFDTIAAGGHKVATAQTGASAA